MKHNIKVMGMLIRGITVIMAVATISGCQKSENSRGVEDTSIGNIATEGITEEDTNTKTQEIMFYDYPTDIKVPSMKALDTSLEETSLLPSLESQSPGGWAETDYVYPFVSSDRDIAVGNKEAYIKLLTDNGFSADTKGFYVKDNVGVTCGVFYTDTSDIELTVFIFENFDKYKSNDDFAQRSFWNEE